MFAPAFFAASMFASSYWSEAGAMAETIPIVHLVHGARRTVTLTHSARRTAELTHGARRTVQLTHGVDHEE